MTETCGECKYYEVDEIAAKCEKHYIICNDDAPACEHFKARAITNGDKIRQMSDEELAEILIYSIKIAGGLTFMYSSLLIFKCYHKRAYAVKATLAKLKEICK